jgi:O-methyltransferase
MSDQPERKGLVSRIWRLSTLMPGDSSSGLRGRSLKAMSSVVSSAGKFLQGINPIWNQDKEFLAVYDSVREIATLDKKCAYVLFNMVRHCQNIAGDMAELGVYKGGGSKIILSQAKPEKCLHMFDTFAGFPPVNADKDLFEEGDFANVNAENIHKEFTGANIRLYVGRFPDTTDQVPQDAKFCFVHVDADLYQSQLDGCKFFYPRMNQGGVMLLDNYGSLSCPGAKTAVDEFFADKPEHVIYLPTAQAFVIKL